MISAALSLGSGTLSLVDPVNQHFDPTPHSVEIATATARLLDTVRTLTDGDVLAPSLLPGWSRGHVLTHLARSADGHVNLLAGAREGVERSAYASPQVREADIEAGARRPLAEQLADLTATHRRFVDAVAAMPAQAWDFALRWGSAGERRPASAVLESRLREVAIHHVDLGAGYTAADWPPPFALRILRSVVPSYEARGITACVLHATDAGDAGGTVVVAGGSDVEVSGPAYALASWLLGRDEGAGLTTTGGQLPTPPAWR